jgi:hypothetical protein
MITFLNSIILTALAAVIIPFLIHLFNKQKKNRIQFSTIRFLKYFENQRIKRIKIFQYLLILIRTLIILLLVIAFARPTLTMKQSDSGYQANTTAVLIIDNTINMQSYDDFGEKFSRAKEKLLKILNQFNPQDNVFLIATHNPDTLLTEHAISNSLQCSYSIADWQAILTKANNVFRNFPNFNKELHIISDFKFHDPSFSQNIDKMSDVRAYLFRIGTESWDNTTIDTIIVKNKIFELNKPINLDVSLRNLSTNENRETEIHLFINSQRVAFQKIKLNALETKTIPLSFQTKKYGQLDGYVEINDDDLLADNRYYFSINIPKSIKILFVDNDHSKFMYSAFESIESNSHIYVSKEDYKTWGKQNLSQFNIIYLSDFYRFTSFSINRLKNFLQKGGSLILMPGNSTSLLSFNQVNKFLGLNLKINKLINPNSRNEYFSLNDKNMLHSLFRGLFREKNFVLPQLQFYKYFKFIPNENGESIISFNNNDPYIYHIKHEMLSIIIITSSFEDNWSDLQYRGLFLPLLTRLIQYGAFHTTSTPQMISIGSEKILSTDLIQNSESFFLLSPNGEEDRIAPEIIGQNLVFYLKQLNIPGNYKLTTDGNVLFVLSVNVDRKRNLYPHFNLEKLATNNHINIFEESTQFAETINKARFGIELWKFLILIVLLLILIESYLVKQIHGFKNRAKRSVI